MANSGRTPDPEHTFMLPPALTERVPSQEDLKSTAETSFAGECVGELVSFREGASNQRYRLLDFLAGKLGIEDPTKDSLVRLVVFLHESRSGKVVLIPERARALVRELIELAVKEQGAERKSGGTADFGHRSRRYLRHGFSAALGAILELDESFPKASGMSQAGAGLKPDGKLILANEYGRDLSMDVLQEAVGDSLPEGVTVEQLYEVLHRSAARRVEATSGVPDSGLLTRLRERFGALFRTRPE